MGSPGGSSPIGPARSPGPLGGRLARLPGHLYGVGLGRLFGWRLVLIEHTGRRSGRIRQTVVGVVRRDEHSVDVAAARGRRSDWYRNLLADPTARISTGSWQRRPAVASLLGPEEAAAVLADHARRHRRAARRLARRFDVPVRQTERLARTVPVVRLGVITPVDR
jgi:deazaflavin-dependent oxidoreductase (nitroreductase family)